MKLFQLKEQMEILVIQQSCKKHSEKKSIHINIMSHLIKVLRKIQVNDKKYVYTNFIKYSKFPLYLLTYRIIFIFQKLVKFL